MNAIIDIRLPRSTMFLNGNTWGENIQKPPHFFKLLAGTKETIKNYSFRLGIKLIAFVFRFVFCLEKNQIYPLQAVTHLVPDAYDSRTFGPLKLFRN